jgi:hypothetical protein
MSTYTIPNVVSQHPRGERITDVYSHLLTERIVYLGTAIDAGVANALIAQLLYLESDNADGDIRLYINCEGGDPGAMLAIYDTMRYIRPQVATTCVGQASRGRRRAPRRGRRGQARCPPPRSNRSSPARRAGTRIDPGPHPPGGRGGADSLGHRNRSIPTHGSEHPDAARRHLP